jgi:hypothetical protein
LDFFYLKSASCPFNQKRYSTIAKIVVISFPFQRFRLFPLSYLLPHSAWVQADFMGGFGRVPGVFIGWLHACQFRRDSVVFFFGFGLFPGQFFGLFL